MSIKLELGVLSSKFKAQCDFNPLTWMNVSIDK